MKHGERPDLAAVESVSAPDEKALRLRRFVGPMVERDREIVEYWRSATPSEHARAMIDLAEYAEQMVRQTGITKNPEDMFPGFSINGFKAA